MRIKQNPRMNILLNVPVTYDMLTGHGKYVHSVHWAQISLNAYFQQILDLALKALQGTQPSLQALGISAKEYTAAPGEMERYYLPPMAATRPPPPNPWERV